MCQGPEAGRSWLCKELKEEGHSGGMEAAGRRSVGSGGGGLKAKPGGQGPSAPLDTAYILFFFFLPHHMACGILVP